PRPRHDTRSEATRRVAVQPDGPACCRRSLVYHGAAALRQPDAWTDVPPGERRRVMSAELQDAHSKSRLRLLTVDDHALGDFDRPVRGEVEFDLPGHFSETEREGSFTDSRVWSRLLSYT